MKPQILMSKIYSKWEKQGYNQFVSMLRRRWGIDKNASRDMQSRSIQKELNSEQHWGGKGT